MMTKSQYYSCNLDYKRSPKKVQTDSWTDVDEYCTSSDTSPILTYRNDRHRRLHQYYKEDRDMSLGSALAKFFLFSIAMVIFFFMMYIPVYRSVNKTPAAVVAGWSMKMNRDTKLYVQPNNTTTKLSPLHICTVNKKAYLLIIVTSAVDNFESRAVVRESWGKYNNYVKMYKLYKQVKDKYKNYNYTHDLFLFPQYNSVKYQREHNQTLRLKRGISYGWILPNLAKAVKDNIENSKTEPVPDDHFDDDDDEKRFEEGDERSEFSDGVIEQFDMNKVLDDIGEDYEYSESNVMKIPPNGYQEVPDFSKMISLLKNKNPFTTSKDVLDDNNTEKVLEYDKFNIEGVPPFKLIFLLGMPANNNSLIQDKINKESNMYGDILQEDFIDSYNNLTLKSIMMLKWVVKNCKDSVRYILKTDDDMFVNVPNLIDALRAKTKAFEQHHRRGETENMLIGRLITNAQPVLDRNNKWYSPRYMYSGKVYPKYLSGTGYLLTLPTAKTLYEAALRVQYFHLEDVYITGFCAMMSRPRVYPRAEPNFHYGPNTLHESCMVYSHIISHHLKRAALGALVSEFSAEKSVDRCERYRLTNIRHYRIKIKRMKEEMAANINRRLGKHSPVNVGYRV